MRTNAAVLRFSGGRPFFLCAMSVARRLALEFEGDRRYPTHVSAMIACLSHRETDVTSAGEPQRTSVRPRTGEEREPAAPASRNALSGKGQPRPEACRRGSCLPTGHGRRLCRAGRVSPAPRAGLPPVPACRDPLRDVQAGVRRAFRVALRRLAGCGGAHGAYANRTRGARARLTAGAVPSPSPRDGAPDVPLPAQRERRREWAKLIARVFEVDPLHCRCGGTMRIVAFILDPTVIRKILQHRPRLEARAHAPPRG